jgi:hypothetical protein
MITGTLYHFPLPALEEQAKLVEKHRVDTLLFCPNSWALRHVFINQDTGETVRQLVKAAEPTLFLTLSKAGKTVEEAARALTTFL